MMFVHSRTDSMRNRTLSCVIVLSLLSAACAKDLNARTAQRYFESAKAADQAGDWPTAQEHWWRAYVNVKLAGARKQSQALLLYNYGRASGVLCQFDKAENSLKEALALDQQDSGPVYMDLVELGRLTSHQQKFEEARRYYERSLVELDRVNGQSQSPIGYSEILDEYASVLAALGRQDDSETKRQRAKELRDKHPDMHSLTTQTPYGQACEKSGK